MVTKGVHGIQGVTRRPDATSHHRVDSPVPLTGHTGLTGSAVGLAGKPWKKHYNRHKKEKTRRIVQPLT